MAEDDKQERRWISINANPLGEVLEEVEEIKKKTVTVNCMAPEMLWEIAKFVSLWDLVSFDAVCRRWREIGSTHPCLWLRHLELACEDTGYSKNTVPPISLFCERIKRSFSLASIRKSLLLYDTAGLNEKQEWIQVLASRLLFGKILTSEDRGPNGYVFPEWTKRLNDGKRAVFFGLREIRKKVPLESELLLYSWSLTYKHQPTAGPFPVKFYSNHEMSCESHGDNRFNWRIVEGNDGGSLQVENFPRHRLYRNPQGYWCWENDHVICVQDVEDGVILPMI